jgi:HAD superfamily hydrolase (TIGR01484 family)
MRIRLVALDFDMTLVDHTDEGPKIAVETRRMLEGLLEEGIEVGIASGRYVWEMKDILERIGMKWADPFPSFYVTREAFVFRKTEGRMTPDRARNDPLGREMERFMQALSSETGAVLSLVEEAGLTVAKWILYSDYAFEIHFGSETEAERAMGLVGDYYDRVGVQARLHRNRATVNAMHPATGKGDSLLHLSRSLGLEPAQVLAIGDSLNDLDMLDGRLGFRSGAVGNAAEVVKDTVAKAGGVVASGTAGRGVAEIVAAYRAAGLL